MTAAAARALGLLRELPAEPWRGWVRYAPTRWPGPAVPWIDLAVGGLGASTADPSLLEALGEVALPDVLYLPPVPPELAAARDRLAARQAQRGTPVLLQLLPGEATPALEGVTAIWDLLLPALAGEEPKGLGAGGGALSPLAPGLGGQEAWERAAAAVRAAALPVLQGVQLELSGRERRELGAGLPEERYLELFHGAAPAATALARLAARHGLLPLLPRPLPRPPLLGAGNLRVAGALAVAGELSLLLGEAETRGQALLRAARFAERAPHDLAALAREGNLGVLPWLDGEAREMVAQVIAGAQPALLAGLLAELAA